MRNPLPVLAAALWAAAGAFAADLPKWQTRDESYSAWRVIQFTDASGTGHYLYCRWSECGANVTRGQALLYVLEKAGDEHYMASAPYNPQYAQTYAGKTWEWLKGKTTNVQFQSTKTTFKSEVSQFALDMSAKPNKAVLKGTAVAIPVDPEHEAVSETGWIFRVLQPVAVANDAPQAAPVKPGPVPTPKPKPKTHPTSPTPKPKPKTPVTTQPSQKPGAHAATELSLVERYWLIPTERKLYDAAVDATKKPTPAALGAAYKKGRETVAGNLRTDRGDLKAQYNALIASGDFAKIDDLLTNQNYSGFDVELRPAEFEALKTVLKTADAHTDFTAPNAAGQYGIEHLPFLASDGKVNLNEHLMAHRVTEKFRAMLPKKPGDTVDPFAPLTDADFARIPDKAQRDALKKEYDEAWAKADTNEKKAAVNKDFRAKIDQLVAAAPKKPSTSTPFDPASITDINKLLALPWDDQKKFCSAMSSDAGALANCGDILANANGPSAQCMDAKGAGATATIKAKNDCMAKVNACKAQAGGEPGKRSMASLSPKMQTQCAKVLGPQEPPATVGTGRTGSATVVPSPSSCPGGKADAKADPKAAAKSGASGPGKDVDTCPKTDDDKGPDPNFYTNLGNGISFGIGGLLLASFLGGPLLMLAVAVAAGAGGYYFSKSNTEPKKKGK
jgi:hypothetical protein